MNAASTLVNDPRLYNSLADRKCDVLFDVIFACDVVEVQFSGM
jgi:hypothetical protein